jgi:glutaredoxin
MPVKDYAKKVKGKKKDEIFLFALSTCGWCAKTKKLLDSLGVEYSYIDVDLVGDEIRDEVVEEFGRWNPDESFPTIVINNKDCIIGFKEEELKGILK